MNRKIYTRNFYSIRKKVIEEIIDRKLQKLIASIIHKKTTKYLEEKITGEIGQKAIDCIKKKDITIFDNYITDNKISTGCFESKALTRRILAELVQNDDEIKTSYTINDDEIIAFSIILNHLIIKYTKEFFKITT